jgi:hypothetical protein
LRPQLSAKQRVVWIAVLLVVTGGLGALLATRSVDAGPSSLSRGGLGWIRARHYVETRAVEARTVETRNLSVVTLDRPLESLVNSEGRAGPDGSVESRVETSVATWVLTFPWQYGTIQFDAKAVRHHLRRGGRVLFGYSSSRIPQPAERALLAEFVGQPRFESFDRPLAPRAWWEARRSLQELEAMEPFAGESLSLRSLDWRPSLPDDALVLYRTADGDPVISEWKVGSGRMLVMPAEVLANGRFDETTAGWLESLIAWSDGPWIFDEYHHGVVHPAEVETASGRVTFGHLLLQILFVYLAAVWAWSRRMGPPWRPEIEVTGSADSLLLGLGRLHDRRKHYPAAARLLLDRAQRLDRRVVVGEDLYRQAEGANASDLIELCNALEGRRL